MYIHIYIHTYAVLCLVAQSCLTLCDLMDCSPPGSSVHGDSPGKNTGVGCHALLQGIFPTQRLNPGLPHCRQIHTHTHTHIHIYGLPQWLSGKETTCNAVDAGDIMSSVPGWGRSPGGGHSNRLQCFCLENPMDRRA